MRASRDGGCGFHDPRSGRCNIYAARPVDCRLYPLDIALIDGSYYWILRRYCDITDADLKNLIAFGEQILPQFRDRLRDYATVAVDGMDSLSFRSNSPSGHSCAVVRREGNPWPWRPPRARQPRE